MITLGRGDFTVDLLESIDYQNKAEFYYDRIRSDAFDRPNGLMMEPSIFCNWVSAGYEYGRDDEGLYARVVSKWELSDEAREIIRYWKELHANNMYQSDLIVYRSQLALSCGSLVYNEMPVKFEKAAVGAKYVRSMIWGNPEIIELNARLADYDATFMKRLADTACIGEHTEKYIKDHAGSSVLPGLKWGDVTSEGLDDILFSTKSAYDWIARHYDECDLEDPDGRRWSVSPFSCGYGMRARSPKDLLPLNGEYDGKLRRSRQIIFCAALSAIWAMIPNHGEFYKEYVQKVFDECDFEGESFSPILDGGRVWENIYNVAEGGTYHNHDGSAWEVHEPAIEGRSLPFSVMIKDHTGPSGFGFTTLKGIKGHCVLSKAFEYAFPRVKILGRAIHGDDGGYVYEDGSDIIPDIPGLYERDSIASRCFHFLGMTMTDEERWHPLGLKLTVDRPDKGHRLVPGLTKSITLDRSYDDQTINVVLCTYKGESLDGTPFREVLSKASFEELDYIAPHTIRDYLEREEQVGRSGEFELDVTIGSR